MKKNILALTVVTVSILIFSITAFATERPMWTSSKIPAGQKDVETCHAMKIVTLANRYDCSVVTFKDGDIEIFAIDNYYRNNNLTEHIYISKGKIIIHTIAAFRDKGKIIKYGPTYPVFKEKFLKEIHGLPWKIRKEILDAFPPPQKK